MLQQAESIHPGARGPRGVTAGQCGYGRGAAQDVSPASRPGSEISGGGGAWLWYLVAAPLRPAPADDRTASPQPGPPAQNQRTIICRSSSDSGQTSRVSGKRVTSPRSDLGTVFIHSESRQPNVLICGGVARMGST